MRSIDADIAYLDGFLKAVEIVAGRRGRMVANWFASSGNPLPGLTTFLREREIPFERLTATAVSREELLAEVWKATTQLMAGLPESVRNDIEWQLEECLGLISTGIGDDQPLHPLFHRPLQRVLVEGETERVALLIQFEQVVVVLFCDSHA